VGQVDNRVANLRPIGNRPTASATKNPVMWTQRRISVPRINVCAATDLSKAPELTSRTRLCSLDPSSIIDLFPVVLVQISM
jgi:hypothetical protein